MKTFIFFGAAAAALIAAPVAAQPMKGEGRFMDRAQVESRTAAGFARVDANRDGFVTQAEAEGARTAIRGQRMEGRGERREARFARLDADRNGVISRDEFFAARGERAGNGQRVDRGERRAMRMDRRGQRAGMRGGMGGQFGAQAFARMDMNRDGRISLAEATRFRLERFDRVDANDDGRVTPEERQAIRAERQTR